MESNLNRTDGSSAHLGRFARNMLFVIGGALGAVNQASAVLMVGDITTADIPTVVSGVGCDNTVSFLLASECVGQVTDPKNESNVLLDYLNGGNVTDGGDNLGIGFIGSDATDSSSAWGTQGSWLEDSKIDPPPGDSGGFFSVTGGPTSGDFTFNLVDKYIEHLVVTVKDGGGWSAYYYDLTGTAQTSITDSWDTLGLTSASGNIGPNISHMMAAYIPGVDVPVDPDPMPLPGTLALFGLGLSAMGFYRRKRR